jgi:predicted kinase
VKIIITVGLPGSGKSTHLQRLGVNPISSDELRRQILDDPADQSVNARIFAAIRYLIGQRIAVGRPITYIDATHLRRWERRNYVELAKHYGCELEALFFDVPLEVCIQRNQQRVRQVPEQAIRNMSQCMEPPTVEEGFTRIIRVS